jgi:putative transposase
MKNRKRNRMLDFDYSSNRLYFITICVQDRVCCFGHVGAGRDLPVQLCMPTDSSLPAHLNPPVQSRLPTNSSLPVQLHQPAHLNLPVHVGAGHDQSLQIMQLNLFGNIAQNQWHWLQKQYPYVVLHSFIVMPNHVHGILEIDSDLISDKNIKIKSVSELVGAYKTTSSKQIHLAGNTNFSWQRSFHDHIIRNDISYQRISNYIDTNAERWDADTFFENF